MSKAGYEVTIIDNLSRRRIDEDLECESLTPITSIDSRLDAWYQLTGKIISYKQLDIARNYNAFKSITKNINPSIIIHFAEQRAAPFSMKSDYTKRYTITNNTMATSNVLNAMVSLDLKDTHLIHLGTAGVYGYGAAGIKIPEGYLNVNVEGKEIEIPYPPDPGSVYHMTKCMDALQFHYYNKNDGLLVTDLHQGIIWGTETPETMLDEKLINRFDYDGDYGTVLNRFLMQAAIKLPLTVYGTGEQTRAFININDMLTCIRLAAENPPEKGSRVRIINQVAEQLRLIDLAQMISNMMDIRIAHYPNPRYEAKSNELRMSNDTLLKMGLKPTLVKDGLLEEICQVAWKYRGRCRPEKIKPTSYWNKKTIAQFKEVNINDKTCMETTSKVTSR
jgi:UDP-sulfoquinovose synthase